MKSVLVIEPPLSSSSFNREIVYIEFIGDPGLIIVHFILFKSLIEDPGLYFLDLTNVISQPFLRD